jgi:hypothetical protein
VVAKGVALSAEAAEAGTPREGDRDTAVVSSPSTVDTAEMVEVGETLAPLPLLPAPPPATMEPVMLAARVSALAPAASF